MIQSRPFVITPCANCERLNRAITWHQEAVEVLSHRASVWEHAARRRLLWLVLIVAADLAAALAWVVWSYGG